MVNIRSLTKLRVQNEKLRKQIQAKGELKKLEEERIKLGNQNKRLLSELKRSPTEKKILRTFRNIGKGSFIVGKSVGKTLMRYGRFLDQNQKRFEKRSINLKKSSKRKR